MKRNAMRSGLEISPFRHFGIFFILISLIIFLFNLSNIKLFFFNTDKDFKSTTGVIIVSEIKETLIYGSVYYKCKIRYKYSVNKRIYFSDIIKKDTMNQELFNLKDKAENFCANYSKGKKLNVYYVIKNPALVSYSPKLRIRL
jgi:hypothetical protein